MIKQKYFEYILLALMIAVILLRIFINDIFPPKKPEVIPAAVPHATMFETKVLMNGGNNKVAVVRDADTKLVEHYLELLNR